MFIIAEIQERIRRKYIQYKGKKTKKQIEQTIRKRDELQDDSGYYNIYDKTQVIDVTNCTSVEEATKKVLEYVKIEALA